MAPKLFDAPQYVQAGLSLFFTPPPNRFVRSRVDKFESILKADYNPPQSFGIPDSAPPEVPRIAFASKDGLSNVFIAQSLMAMIFRYDDEQQASAVDPESSLHGRSYILFDLMNFLGQTLPDYAGWATQVRLPSKRRDEVIIDALYQCLLANVPSGAALNDIEVKTTVIRADTYFSNVTVKNFRTWTIAVPEPRRKVSLSNRSANERGAEVIGDFNDRFAYNEGKRSRGRPNRENASELIRNGVQEVSEMVEQLKGLTI